MDLLKSLEECRIVAEYEVNEFRSWTTGGYYNVTVHLRDGSTLFTREYVDEQERCYSFHWQDAEQNLRKRWDNAPHHRTLSTHPHHKHLPNQVIECRPVDLSEVLNEIEADLESC